MTSEAFEKRLEFLAAEVDTLKKKVEDLSIRFSQGGSADVDPASRQLETYPPPIELDTDELWSKVGKSSLLPRIATICFVLVVALVLRTLTDSGMIGKQLGSFLGMGYAAVLLAVGWRELARQSRLAMVFPVCGAVLMYVIVVETHARFESVSSLSVYLILFVVLMALSLTSRRFKLSGLNCLALIGTSCVAIVIDFPRPNFAQLILLLLATNVVAYVSSRRLIGCWWSRWVLFAFTAAVWTLWTFKLRFALRQGGEISSFLSISWFIPIMMVFVVTYTVMAVRNAVADEKWNVFDLVIPSLVGFCVYPLLRVVIVTWFDNVYWLGIAGVFMASFYFATAAWLFKNNKTGGPAVCGFTFAGAVFLAMAFPDAVGSILLAIPVWSAVALGLALLSGVCEIGGIRLASYLLQGLACLAAVFSGILVADTPSFMVGSSVAVVITLLAGYQYRWCRQHPLSCSIGFFAMVDPDDRSGIVLFLSCLLNGFLLLQMVSYHIMAPFVSDISNMMIGSQSVLINIGAMGLMFFALSERNNEILGVAVLVFIIGALKVFFYDLFRSSGIPLVMSVFSFGAAAAVCSIALNRWQQDGKSDLLETDG
ncbi:MAG: DUF2339 domain-containing protein [Proteobacteria bacterium]|nr:DUF2339 domain-containing protein [Pseudomonadota bacterium]MBU1715896.1 DUF2339 domain-containing protein [Pseudomonadota bacterium]